ncbi:single-stranded-DNA-specific exonuclease RecJ [Bacillus niameyensis]|uniref:single-stranded-DNA-specific exonuclease RecJ n=1 Tax=Bacillus niameyensis TaxID=1522308 RepID=UPI000780975E|nr:single-stranded-DNA-specific exonuclease RecJ [Bacillus niameyensis]
MLFPKKRWIVQESSKEAASHLADSLKIDPLVAILLLNRGIHTVDQAYEFLYTEKMDVHNPFLFNDMEKTVNRIRTAIDHQESILVFGDYDADGVTSTSVIMETLRGLGANVEYYIPNRFTEGYGPNEGAFRKAKLEGIQLIITVDTGISAISEAKLAKELEIDLIITDHHEAGAELPDAFSIIHPKIPGSTYPFSDLAGVGVAFKLAHALNGDLPEHLLDLVAVGTIADLVPLQGENRLLVKKGLNQLVKTTRPGLLELCKIASIKLSEINEETVGFAIAPRLNAVGRLDHAGPAADLLMTHDPEEAMMLAEEIDSLNKQRQQIVAEIANEAIDVVEKDYSINDSHVIVIGKEGWNPGVIGIVASRLVEKFYRPTIVLSYDPQTGLAKGSARSIAGFDLFKNLSTCRDILPHFGGHTMAAGMTLSIENVDELRNRLNEAASQQLSSEDFIPITELDASINIEDIDIDSISQLNMLAPYGMNNPKPTILIENAITTDIKKIGANKNHLKILFEGQGHFLDGVGFNLGNLADDLSPGSKAAVIGELAINEWNNRQKPQIFIRDMAVKEWQLFDLRGNRQIDQWIQEISKKDTLFIFFSEKHYNEFGRKLESNLITDLTSAEKFPIDRKNIVLFDIPPSLEWLGKLVGNKFPSRIYAHFFHTEDHFFSTIPTRDHFKWYYAFLLKRQSFDLKRYGLELAKHRGWSKETIQFMSQVFFELDFVTMEDGLIRMNQQKLKKDLGDSPTYQRKQQQIMLEKELLYSSYTQLKQWFHERLALGKPYEEEVRAWI